MWRRALAKGLCAAAACRSAAEPSAPGLWRAAAAAVQAPSCSNRAAAAAASCLLQRRPYARAKDPEDEPEVREPGANNPRLKELVEEILTLNLLEISDLTEILSKRLNIPAPGSIQYNYGPVGAMPAAGAPAPVAEAAPPPKTEFDVKLDGFDAAAKIKVIKEVRGMTSLGLKEAKEPAAAPSLTGAACAAGQSGTSALSNPAALGEQEVRGARPVHARPVASAHSGRAAWPQPMSGISRRRGPAGRAAAGAGRRAPGTEGCTKPRGGRGAGPERSGPATREAYQVM